MKIEIRPLEQKRWHGKTGEESFSRPKKITALVDPAKMEYATGLTKEEAVKYGETLNEDLSPNYNPEIPHSFWDGNLATVTLSNGTMFFDTERTVEFIKHRICKASKYVANSMKEYEEGLFPEATHVIYNEAEEAEEKATKITLKNKAREGVASIPRERKNQILMILTGRDVKKQSDSYVTVEIEKVIETQADLVIQQLEGDKEILASHAMVLECLNRSILRKERYNIMYMDSILGSDPYEVAKDLLKDENQDLRISLLSKMTS